MATSRDHVFNTITGRCYFCDAHDSDQDAAEPCPNPQPEQYSGRMLDRITETVKKAEPKQ